MSGVVIWAGGVAPEAYVLELTSIGGVALSTVTASVLKVRDPSGVEANWTVTQSYNATTGILTLTHQFNNVTPEVTRPGLWSVYAELTVPGGKLRSKPRGIFVRAKFDVAP